MQQACFHRNMSPAIRCKQPFVTMLLTVLLVTFVTATSGTLEPASLSEEQLQLCASLQGLQTLAGQASRDTPANATAAAAQLWMWGFPLLTMSQTAQRAIRFGAINKLFKAPTLVTPQYQLLFNVVAPNCDTLYTTCFLDLSGGPQIFSAPNTNGRYYVMQLTDFYSNVFGNPGAPTTGTAASKWVVLPPGYNRTALPLQLQKLPSYQSNTTGVWLLGRTYVANPSDLASALAVQQQYSLEPAIQSLGSSTPSTTPLETAVTAANALLQQAGWQLGRVTNSTPAFAAIMGLAKAFPPASGAAGALNRVSSLGLSRGRGFTQAVLSAQQQAVLQAGSQLGQACAAAYAASSTIGISQPSGWYYTTKAGKYGRNFLLRAAIAWMVFGANEPNITIYATSRMDGNKQPLIGNQTYSITFPGVPPARDFASLTLYSTRTNLLMTNSYSDRSVLSFEATPGLQWNSDGSITIYLSSKPPGKPGSKQLANWLPVGEDETFWAMLRLYGPSPEVIAGKYSMPPIMKL